MALILNRPWTSQPQVSARPTVSVPLMGLWVPGQADATGRNGIPTLGPATGLSIGVGGVGRAWRNTGSAVNSYIELLPNSGVLPTNTCTIIVIGRQLTLNNGGVGVDTTNAAEKCGISIANASSQIDWDFGGTTSGTTRLRSAALTNLSERDVWACTTGPRGMEVWRNGVKVASNAANPTRTASTGRWGIGLNVTSAWSSASNTPFAYYCAAISAEQLPTGFLALLTSPEAAFGALFQPRRIFIPVSVAGGGSSTFTITPAGGVTFSGSADQSHNHLIAPAGGIVLSGSASQLRTRQFVPAAGVVFSGTAAISTSAATSYTITPSGGVVFAGTGSRVGIKNYVPAGGVSFAGTAGIVGLKNYLPAGGVVFSGTSSVIFIPAGGLPAGADNRFSLGASRSMGVS